MYIKFLAAAVMAASIASGATASTVQNGSFEDIGAGTLNGSGWNHFSNIPGWTGDPNVEVQSAKTLGSIDAQDGDYYAELDTNQDAGIYQDIALTAGRYLLSFWYSPRVNDLSTSTNDMIYSISNGSTLLSGAINGAPNASYPHGVWTEVTGSFKLTTQLGCPPFLRRDRRVTVCRMRKLRCADRQRVDFSGSTAGRRSTASGGNRRFRRDAEADADCRLKRRPSRKTLEGRHHWPPSAFEPTAGLLAQSSCAATWQRDCLNRPCGWPRFSDRRGCPPQSRHPRASSASAPSAWCPAPRCSGLT